MKRDNHQDPESEAVRAEELLRQGCYDEAILIYRALVEKFPEEESHLLALAWAYHDGGYEEEALKSFQDLFARELERKVFSGFAFDELVRLYKQRGESDLLLDVCERAVQAQGDDFALMGDLGDAYLRVNRFEDAIRIFGKMVVMETDAAAVYCLLGNAYILAGETAQGIAAYAEAIVIEPEKREAFLCRQAETLRRAGAFSMAADALRQCLSERENPLLYLDLADLLIEMGDMEEGESLLRRAISLDPASEGAYCNRLGNSLTRAGCHESAIAFFQRAMRADPTNPFYAMQLAAAYSAIGQEDMAARVRAGCGFS